MAEMAPWVPLDPRVHLENQDHQDCPEQEHQVRGKHTFALQSGFVKLNAFVAETAKRSLKQYLIFFSVNTY